MLSCDRFSRVRHDSRPHVFWMIGSGDSKQVTGTQMEAIERMAEGISRKIVGCLGPEDH